MDCGDKTAIWPVGQACEFSGAADAIVSGQGDRSALGRAGRALLKLGRMVIKSRPAVPDPLALRQALDLSAPLNSLRRRLEESSRRYAAIRPCLPEALVAHVSPGPVDDTGWTLIAANASVAAKLRHLQPAMESRLSGLGFRDLPLRIKGRSG